MEMHKTKATKASSQSWLSLIDALGEQLAANGITHDQNATFVADNYALLKTNGYLTAMIPKALGGGGVTFKEMCDILVKIAHYCPSTALALSMHQHLLAANIWKYTHHGTGGSFLKDVVENNLVLVSTGARDWLDSNGTMIKTDTGYLVSGRKQFASQSSQGDVLVTSMPYHDPEEGWQVIHFTIAMTSEGIALLDDWYTLGMRGTGSQTVTLDNVFVPNAAIVMKRLKGEFPMFWNAVLTVALPLTMAPYVGIAEKAMTLTLDTLKVKQRKSPHITTMLGDMNNSLTLAKVLHNDMIAITNNLDFQPEAKMGVDILTRKTLVANACKDTVAKAMGIVGGQSFYRKHHLERLFRDVQAASFHTLPEKEQQHFTGDFLLKL
ncbi:alkylation response protein AidB-like acyl-CoA dehydrogenase [Winogradskyella eximia]|uniref:Alkylation response protein AidB-like acyl-CoA dehydrogenase n=1 Tax=Winogradskyella eximia TaxID=262006 RepID=A0A3D9H7T5_9FLAO|nr:acyl-CoA dehydrogenase family protein [Winogradskyella eximia]RED45560.1 alkylation response protein AidB-like acyl-CoA dehydrogenase [Winogradskyella eximia]